MSQGDDLGRVVEFKLLLCRLLEEHLGEELRAAANAQGRRLPTFAKSALRTGAHAAVRRLSATELLAFASGTTWDESLRAAVATGAWERLMHATVRLAFPGGPA